MPVSENIQIYSVGKSDYAKHAIQPWDIWKEYNLNPWDADIVKRVLRNKEGEARTLDYEKIIHICKYRIAELSKETEVVKAEKPVEDEENDDTTVLCLDETMRPATFYTEGTKWHGKYAGYSVFMNGNAPYMYLGVDADRNHLYADLSGLDQWLYSRETHLPPKTFKLKYANFFGNHRSSLKIGPTGTNYEKHDYIITCDGQLFHYFGMEGEKFCYRNMSAKRADGTYPEVLCDYKLENKAIQFTL